MSPVMMAYFAGVGITNGHDGVHGSIPCFQQAWTPETCMYMNECLFMKSFIWSCHFIHVDPLWLTRRYRIHQCPRPLHHLYSLFTLGLIIHYPGRKWLFQAFTRAHDSLTTILGEEGGRRAHLISHSGWKCCMSLWRLINSSVQWAVDWYSRLTGDAATSPASLLMLWNGRRILALKLPVAKMAMETPDHHRCHLSTQDRLPSTMSLKSTWLKHPV